MSLLAAIVDNLRVDGLSVARDVSTNILKRDGLNSWV